MLEERRNRGTEERKTDLENKPLLPPVRQGKLNLAIQAAWSQERRIQGVSSVGGHDDLDIHSLVEAIHLVEELHQNSLHLPAAATLAA